ncbi:uncharacterized protein BCR38DRAFT_432750 [Pseudomassariella vexata]|uniref:Uncharacterized protein n=1 Tax=Pseudomassariella vexata TaxID=1141098 RepID=A0A1Y2E1K2_9PEZI|nr:uncharacterized protein BCR38DRAFT_432750 [Pseudomassariella vexata]ORY65428.1 hypothetical protein BCR38DRAFT_432750 [Pseudomassariella vexata]
MPTAIDGAVFGPQVPGPQRPNNGTELADLNQCPLNACCDIWGQYCTDTRKDGAASGTAAPDTNGCISNCGTKIINSESPGKFSRVAYFEAWNYEQECLHMSPDQSTPTPTITSTSPLAASRSSLMSKSTIILASSLRSWYE